MHNKTLSELSKLLHSKQISSTELTRHYLDRIAASKHNAFLHVDADLSLAQAKAADARRATGGEGLRQRLDAGGIDGLHLLGQGEDAVQFIQGDLCMGVVHIELGQVGDPFYV